MNLFHDDDIFYLASPFCYVKGCACFDQEAVIVFFAMKSRILGKVVKLVLSKGDKIK